MAEYSLFVGILFVLIALVAWGSYGMFMKHPSCQVNYHPCVFQFYLSVGTMIFSLCLGILDPKIQFWEHGFLWYGLLMGVVWAPGSVATIIAVRAVGLGVAQSCWAACICIIAFLWGTAYFDEELKSLPLCIFGLIVLCGGIVGMSRQMSGKKDEVDLIDAESPLMTKVVEENNKSKSMLVTGLCAALTTGICSGSVLVPLKLAPSKISGLTMQVSFGFGIFLMSGALLLIAVLVERHLVGAIWGDSPRQLFLNTKLPLMGILSGIFWSVGSVGSVVAVQSPLQMTVGYPLTQCALLVAGIWSLLLLKDLQNPKAFFGFAVVIVSGAGVLGYFGVA